MPLTPELKAYQDDATEKLTGLEARIKAEAELANDESRKPFQIVPFTEVDPAILGPVVKAIANVPSDLSETVGTLRKVCAKQTQPFAMRSDQLVKVLALASQKE